MPKVAIVGPGAIGLALAASVSRRGHEVTLFGRRPQDGFDYTFDGVTEHHDVAVRSELDQAGPVDWVLLCTKAYQTAAAGPWLARLAGSNTALAVVQNGVDHLARVASLWDGDVLPVVISLPSVRHGPGAVQQRRTGTMVVPEGPRAESFAALFDARVRVTPTADFVTEAWSKLLTNATVGACALIGRPNGAILVAPLRELGEAMIREMVAVGRAEGAAFDDVDAMVEATMAKIAKNPEHRSSITEDRLAGRPTEWEARNQVVVRVAARHGLETPHNAAVAALLAAGDPDG